MFSCVLDYRRSGHLSFYWISNDILYFTCILKERGKNQPVRNLFEVSVSQDVFCYGFYFRTYKGK